MHVITSILFLWMQTLTFVRSQEGCTLQQFFKSSHYDEHFDTSNLEDSYPLGKQVRVNCNVGYTGFFKLICVEGTWQPKGAKCQPKSCGHPGDAQFADFALVQGDDFVFGSKVLYTCQKGYQMVSRTNSRLCMAGGWDGVVPVCEAQQCPAIHVDSNVLVTGDPDEATFGNVVRFSCKSNSEMLDGSVEIYCDENGDWSGHAPKCKEISCEAPVIENGDVPEKKQKYNEHEVLHFVCNPSFQRTEDRPSKCTKHVSKAQWNPTPLCEPIKCKLSQSTLGGATYDPAYRNVFLPGDTLRVTCGEKYFISEPEYTSKVTTCGQDGEWTIRPVCQEVRCSNQRDPRVYSWDVYWGQIVTLDETVRYRCRSGYKSPNGRHLARCTRQGWTPDPLCRATTCDPRRFPDADPTHPFKFQYSYNDRVRYTCKEGYTGQFTLTCKDDGWTGSPRCTAITCDPRRVSNADPEGGFKYKYQYNEEVRYICQEGYRGEFTLKCGEQGLTEWIGSAQCAAITCDPRKVSNADLEGGFKYKYQYNEQVRYICQEGYHGEFTLKCGEQGLTEWIGSAQCAVSELTCDIENDPNAVIDGIPKDKYKNKEKVKYNCKNGGHFILTCDETRWVGSRECTGTACTKPSISNGFVVGPINQMVYFACDEGYKLFTKGWWGAAKCDGRDWSMLDQCIAKNKCGKTPVIANGEVAEETGQVTCNEGYRPQVDILTCDKGIWTFDGFTPTTICGSVGNHCSPPPKVENAVVKSAPTKEYFSGSDVTYQCRDDYELQGEKTIECQDGTWEEKNITCTEITCDLKDYPNAAIDGTPKDKYKIKAEVKVNCEDGGHFTLTCGKMGWIASGQCTVPTDDSDFSDAGPVGPPKPIQ